MSLNGQRLHQLIIISPQRKLKRQRRPLQHSKRSFNLNWELEKGMEMLVYLKVRGKSEKKLRSNKHR
jgi:hypothetical protein